MMPYLLQIDITAFWVRDRNPYEPLIFGVIVIVIILAIILINIVKKQPVANREKTSSLSGVFYRITLLSIGRDIGLNREQIKMLAFIFKLDQVSDPQKSISTPDLLDRHFRRAYRVIKQTSKSEEEKQNKLAVLFSTRNLLESNVSGGVTSTSQLKDDISVLITVDKEKYELLIISATGDRKSVV